MGAGVAMRRTMRISIALGLVRESWDEATSYVVEAERLGVDSIWSAEAWGYDAVTPLAYLAAKTSRIRLGSGIMQAGTRTPALVAMTAMSLASLSADRFLLGLGVSGIIARCPRWVKAGGSPPSRRREAPAASGGRRAGGGAIAASAATSLAGCAPGAGSPVRGSRYRRGYR